MTIMIVGTRDAQLEDLVREAASAEATVATDHYEAVAQTSSVDANVLLLDLRGQTGLPVWYGAVRRRHAETPVVMLVSKLEPALMLEAMRAGISECVAEPLSVADLEAALTRVQGQHVSRAGQLVAFVGSKGGVGTTTVAVNTAVALGKALPGRTLLIDLNLAYGDAAVLLGVEPRFSVVDALDNIFRLDAAFLKSLVVSASGIDVLAAPQRAVLGAYDAGRIRTLLDFAARQYSFVVVDAPRSDINVLDGLDVATHLVIVVNQEVPTVRSATRVAATLRQRYGANRIRVLLNRYDPASEIDAEDVERAVGASGCHRVPNNYRLCLEALNRGRPLVLDNHSTVASSCASLAAELSGFRELRPPTSKSSSLLGRLVGRS